jgi:hypothetical protein
LDCVCDWLRVCRLPRSWDDYILIHEIVREPWVTEAERRQGDAYRTFLIEVRYTSPESISGGHMRLRLRFTSEASWNTWSTGLRVLFQARRLPSNAQRTRRDRHRVRSAVQQRRLCVHVCTMKTIVNGVGCCRQVHSVDDQHKVRWLQTCFRAIPSDNPGLAEADKLPSLVRFLNYGPRLAR